MDEPASAAKPTESGSERADRLHEESIVVNGLAQPGHLPTAYSAMIDGGITATNLTVAANEDFKHAMARLEEALDVMDQHDDTDKLRIVRNGGEIRAAKRDGATGVLIGFQNADPIEDNLAYLSVFRRLGLRILQLTYQRRNRLGDGCGEPNAAGLSIFGRQVVEAANDMGILIDLSHVGSRSTLEAIEVSDQPTVFSHANVYAINPILRNKQDDEIRELAATGGVMGITSISRLLTESGRLHGTDLADVLDQIEYVAELVGIDHVGIGLDIAEGMTEEDFLIRRKTFLAKFPELKFGGDFPFEHYFTRGLDSAAKIRAITRGLVERGFTAEDIVKVIGGNFMRVFDAVLV